MTRTVIAAPGPASVRMNVGVYFLLTIVLLAAAAGAALSIAGLPAGPLLLLMSLTSGGLIVIRSEIGRFVSAPMILLLTVSSLAVAGVVFYPAIQNDAVVSHRILFDPTLYATAASIILVSTACMGVGVITGVRMSKRHPGEWRGAEAPFLSIRNPGLVLLGATLPVILIVVGYTPQGLIRRPHYLAYDGIIEAVSLASITSLAGVGLAGLILFSKSTKTALRMAALLLLLVLIGLIFATGSRGLSILPAILLWTYVEGRAARGVRLWVTVGVVSAITLAMLGLPLQLRLFSQGAGFLPYADMITSRPWQAFQIEPAKIFGNVLFGVPLAGEIGVARPALPPDLFWTSVSLLPSGLTSWEELRPLLSWAPSTPFNTFGELYSYGWPFLIGYFLAVGVVIGAVSQSARQMTSSLSRVAGLATLALVGLYSVSIFQYPVRNSSRYLWYLVLIVLLLTVLDRLSRSNHSRKLLRRLP